MAKIQVYINDNVAEKINAIAEQRRAEGAKEKDVSYSSIASMLLELGLRVYEAQMERKSSSFNQMHFNKTLLENVLKTQLISSKLLGMVSLSPHLEGNDRFVFKEMVATIREDTEEIISHFFPKEDDEDMEE
ncbi:conjugal transfer relaxosome DNA-binding protein TraM [Pseudocitrobacter faecalis]|uniref:Relaxosome protein TraM n=1 Tax=Salmonella enterica TaxID=28901 RepID=A0A5U3R694_SALER|nr:relaxosome protein TraM [Salmonella enterica]EBP6409669.1 relaxosome protein TraM [Salmonella enterica]EBP7111284.1 relaxosome protein TraM [Salmonella enterica]